MKKKFLALVMTLSMVLSLVPMTALATEGDKVDTVAAESQSAGADANEGKQESGSNTGANNASSGDSTNTNTGTGENKDQNGESESTDGTTTGGTPETGTEGNGSTGTEPTEPATPKNAAQIGDTPYKTLDAAIDAAKDGATIELLSNATLTFAKMFDKSITFTGNGIIKVENQTVNSYGKTLTLDGSGVELDWIGSDIGSDGQGNELMLALSGVINVQNGAKLHFEFNSTSGNN